MLLPRRRAILLICLILTIIAGLVSRQFDFGALGKLPGDALWASAAYFGIALIFPYWPRGQVLMAAIVISFAVELSQLYHAPWIETVRAYRIGHWFLGKEFHWPDLPAYVVGSVLAMLLDFSSPKMTRSS
jgi:hypothetical protein